MKVFITTSGIGSRLGNLTKYTNKSLVKLGKKPIISYIIESYPQDFEFVISLGYFGNHVRQFLEMAYPERKFIFVDVDNYAGPGSSQVCSQLYAEQYLQEPFIYNDCDTIVKDLENQIPFEFDYNFLVGYPTNDGHYDSFNYDSTTRDKKSKYKSYKLTTTFTRSESENSQLSYIGIAGVYDYKTFWKTLRHAYENDNPKCLSDFYVYHKYKMFKDLRAIKVDNWYDTGNLKAIQIARDAFDDKFPILDKNDQAIFIFDDKKMVIKFFAKDGMVKKLMEHHKSIENITHKINKCTENFFSYTWIDGDPANKNMTADKFTKMLVYFKNSGLWNSTKVDDIEEFDNATRKFYIDKTIARVDQLKEMYDISEDEDIYVNDILIPKKYTIEYMLKALSDVKDFKHTVPSVWHGDFTLDNMIYLNDTHTHALVDWRDSYGKYTHCGDRCYDFAKMNHNLLINYSSVYSNNFVVEESEPNKFYVNIFVNNSVYECRKILKEYVHEAFLIDYDYINALTGLVWVNMSPLHFDPFTKFLFYLGKLTMYQSLKKIYNNDEF